MIPYYDASHKTKLVEAFSSSKGSTTCGIRYFNPGIGREKMSLTLYDITSESQMQKSNYIHKPENMGGLTNTIAYAPVCAFSAHHQNPATNSSYEERNLIYERYENFTDSLSKIDSYSKTVNS